MHRRVMTTDDRLDRIIALLERIAEQNAPAPGLLEQEYTAKLKAAVACGDKAAVKEINKAYHAHKGVRL